MKPAPNTIVQIDELPGEEIEFTIGDPRILMQLSAEQYSDVTTAVIREYSTNAWDAHVMAGHQDPIQIHLPSILDPFFRVVDHGVGMNIDTFKQIYTRFGVSDKRDRMDANGQMGIGSKSGVAYTTEFEVTSVKDGVKTHAVVRRKPDWAITMKVVTTQKTDEPNGTEIVIGVHNVDEFRAKAMNVFKFWLPGRVEINGEPSVHHVGDKITDNLYYSKDWNTSYVVMANVAYRIANPDALFRNTKMSSLNFVAYVDEFKMADGAAPVEFVPSREDLKYTERTKTTLQAIINQFEHDIVVKAQDDINNAANHGEAFDAWHKWTQTLGKELFGDLTYKGDRLTPDFPLLGKRYHAGKHSNTTIAVSQWAVENMKNTILITDCWVEVSSTVKSRSKEYVQQTYPDDKVTFYIYTHATNIDCVWVNKDTMKTVSWADLKAALPKKTRVPGAVNPGGRISGSWDYITRNGRVDQATVPIGEVFYIPARGLKPYHVNTILSMLNSDAAVLIVPANREAKLLRENPKVELFRPWALSKVVLDGESLLSKDAKKVMNIGHDRKSWIQRLDLTRVNDPEFAKISELLTRRDELLEEYNHHQRLAAYLHAGYNGFKEYEPGDDDEALYSKYPLLSELSRWGSTVNDDVYLYLNAKYEQTESESK